MQKCLVLTRGGYSKMARNGVVSVHWPSNCSTFGCSKSLKNMETIFHLTALYLYHDYHILFELSHVNDSLLS